MPITLKKDEWKVKDPSSGNYRGAAILSTTLPEDAAQIIEDTQDALDVEEVRAEQIINDTQNSVDGIEAQSSLILENISKAIRGGTDTTLTIQGMPADAKATGDLKKVLMQLPGTNDYGENGQYPRSTGTGIEWTDYGLPSDEQTAEAVQDWLDAHPEATTTVQDNSLTYKKLVNGTLNFVTPEMYGAYGDGIHDDTNAWQQAVDVGVLVIATSPIYKCSQITVTKNITIDFNNASFIITSPSFMLCTGTITNTINGENYTFDQVEYTISNSSFNNYSGFAYLKGTNHFELGRDYYYGGFACEFFKGRLINQYPVDVENTTIELINPIKVNLLNLNNVTWDNSVNTRKTGITIRYGKNCTIQNFVTNTENCYEFIGLSYSLNCQVINCNINQELNSDDNNSYLITFSDSSYCSIRDSILYNKHWHCATTGDMYLCYHNLIDNCKMYSTDGFAYCDHENGVNTIITNCTIACCEVAGQGVVDNCTIVPLNSNYKHCLVRLMCVTDSRRATYNISNIYFALPQTPTTSYMGVHIVAERNPAQYYLTHAYMKNLISPLDGPVCDIRFQLASNEGYSYVINDIIVEHSNCAIRLGVPHNHEHFDVSKYVLTVKDYTVKIDTGRYQYPSISYGDEYYNVVILDNVCTRGMSGTAIIEELYMNRVYTTQPFQYTTVNKKLIVSNFSGNIENNFLLNPVYIDVTDCMMSSNPRFLINRSTGDGKVYYWSCYKGTWSGNQIT